MAVLFTLVYALGGNAFLGLLTDDKEVIAVADTYFYWALAVPAVGIAAFIWDGIFIGATATRGMLLSMAAAAVSFFYLILWAASRPGKPCSMACLPHLPADAGSGADRLEPGSHPTGISQQEGTCLALGVGYEQFQGKKHYLCIAMTDIKYGFHPPEQGVR